MPDQTDQGIILLDVEPGAAEEFERTFLEGAEGHAVVVCHGPGEKDCPLLSGEECPLLEEAHGIVYQFNLDDPQHRAILMKYRQIAPEGMPIRAVVHAADESRWADLLEGVEVWTAEPTPSQLDGFAAEVESYDRFERPE